MSTRPLIALCRNVARRGPLWVQGQGGNLSMKQGGAIFIKASGVRLEHIRPEDGLVRLNINSLRRQLSRVRGAGNKAEEAYAHILRSSVGKESRRPSMEAGIHVALSRRFVIHFHSLPALLMSHEFKKNPKAMTSWLERHWSEPFRFVKPFRPGLLLSRWIYQNRKATLFLLENHGVVLQSNFKNILEKWEKIENLFCRDWGYEALYHIDRPQPTPLRLYFPDSAVFLDRMKNILKKSSRQHGETRYALRPGAWKKDRDVCEIWKATEILYHACPPLNELPKKISTKVASLPTELYRRKSRTAHG